MSGKHINFQDILGYFGPLIPTDEDLLSGGSSPRVEAGCRPIPLALSACHPRLRAAVERHKTQPQDGQELFLCLTPSHWEWARRLVSHPVTESGEAAAGHISESRRNAILRRCIRHVTLLRELRFPQHKVTAAAALSLWWLTRTKSRRALSLNLDGMMSNALPQEAHPMVPLVASVRVSNCHRLDLTCFERVFAKVVELHFAKCSFVSSADGGYATIPRLVDPCILQAISLRDCAVTDLEWLAQLPELTSLNLEGCEDLEDCTPIRSLKKLKWLSVSQTSVDSFDWLEDCVQLEFLNVSWQSAFDSFSPLAKLTHLQTILADGTSVESLADLVSAHNDEDSDEHSTAGGGNEAETQRVPVEGVRLGSGEVSPVAASVRHLQLAESELTSLEGLDQLEHLALLDISKTTVSPPVGVSHVHALSLAKAGLNDGAEDLTWIAKSFPFLHILNLSEQVDVDDLLPLSALRHTLRALNLHRCTSVTSVPAALACVLEELDVSGCDSIEQPEEMLAQCTELRALNATALPHLTSLAWLAHCPHVQELDLNACESLTSLCGVEHITGTLRSLTITDTKVKTVLPVLPACTALTTFYCFFCPLDDASIRAVTALGFKGP